MKTNLRIGLILIIIVFLSSNFMISWALPVQASAPEATVEEPASSGVSVIDTQPVAQVAVGLIYVLFGALTFIPLLSADGRSGVLRDDNRKTIDQY